MGGLEFCCERRRYGGAAETGLCPAGQGCCSLVFHSVGMCSLAELNVNRGVPMYGSLEI